MEKVIYEGNDELYKSDEFCRWVLGISGSEVVLRDVDKDWSTPFRFRYNVLYLNGVTILHRSVIDKQNFEVRLHGEESSVIYVEKKIKDAVAKFKESKAKSKSLEQLV